MHAPRRLLAVACALACVGARAQDDPNPYYIGLNEGITRNTNINSVAGGPGDTSLSTGIVGGVDQRIGRQRVYGNLNVSLNRYRTYTQLNNTSYGLTAGLGWQTVHDISGSVYASASQGLANLQNNLLQQPQGRNLVRSESAGTRLDYGGPGRLTLGGGYGYSKTHYTNATLYAGDSNNQTADIGLYYHPGETLTLGTALRYTRSSADNAYYDSSTGTYGSNRTTGRNIDLSAAWRATAQSGGNARLSYTRQSNSDGAPGFSGLTGEIDVNYAATGKLSFSGQYNRDASTNGTFYNTFNGTTSQSTVGLASNNSVSNSLSAGANYSATAKVSVFLNTSYRRTTQDDNGTSTVSTGYRDVSRNYSLGANWSIRRFWSLGCSVSRVERRLDAAFASAATSDYDGNVYTCSTQVTLQ